MLNFYIKKLFLNTNLNFEKRHNLQGTKLNKVVKKLYYFFWYYVKIGK